MKKWSIPTYFRNRSLLFWLVMLLVIVPGVPFVLAMIGFVLYTFWPISLGRVALPKPDPGTDHLVIISHGMGDTAESWPRALARTLARNNGHSTIIALDWNPYSQNALRCSVDGKRLGERIGKQAAKHPGLASVHLIGHSCGAFVNLGACRAIKDRQPDVLVQTTYLDAVSVYGGLFWNYGLDNFGTCADFSDAYIDTGDGVPGSNVPLPAAHTFDVTAARLSSGYAGPAHVWPTEYYLQHAAQGYMPDLATSRDIKSRYPAGEFEIAD